MAWNGARVFRSLQLGGFVDVDEPIVLFPVRELIGALLWIALLTRPDIMNSVRVVARYCSSPKLIHRKAARSILGYAVRTSYFGISFQKGTLTGISLISFGDADYASRSTDRRSVSGGVVMCAGCLFRGTPRRISV